MASPALITAVNHVVEVYEDISGEYASRTRQMLDRHDYINALTRIVESPDLQSGFRALRDRGQLDLTFEAVVVQYANEFSQQTVQAAQWRLDNADNLL